ncbi:hypothetical protein N4R57_10860 [Rhodobacteraceae bacterium D3-12]|nr:hypothetical protein N4R57_10860 [Rhodobacteraceae bacterium D3-12]
MFNRITRTTALAALMTPAMALTALAETDANGDGLLTIEEVQAAHPDVTAEAFSTMDLNGDGALDAEEVTAATEAGLLKAEG